MHRKWIFMVVVGLLAVVGSVQAQLADGPWPTYMHDNGRTGYNPDDYAPVNAPVVAWDQRDNGVLPGVLSADGSVIFSYIPGIGPGRVEARNAYTGDLLWYNDVGYTIDSVSPIPLPLVGTNGDLYVLAPGNISNESKPVVLKRLDQNSHALVDEITLGIGGTQINAMVACNDRIYVTSWLEDPSYNAPIVLHRYRPSDGSCDPPINLGHTLQVEEFAGRAACGLAADSNGNIFASGSVYVEHDGAWTWDSYLKRITPSGNVEDIIYNQGTGDHEICWFDPSALVVSEDGTTVCQVVGTGWFLMGPGWDTAQHLFVARLTTTGEPPIQAWTTSELTFEIPGSVTMAMRCYPNGEQYLYVGHEITDEYQTTGYLQKYRITESGLDPSPMWTLQLDGIPYVTIDKSDSLIVTTGGKVCRYVESSNPSVPPTMAWSVMPDGSSRLFAGPATIHARWLYLHSLGNGEVALVEPDMDAANDPGELADGDSIYLAVPGSNLVVTRDFGDCFYVERIDRAWGIKVIPPAGTAVAEGGLVDVIGTIRKPSGAERYIEAWSVEIIGSAAVEPVGMRNSWLGGKSGTWGSSIFSPGGGYDLCYDLYNLGLLAESWGTVAAVHPAEGYFVINDGSVRDGTGESVGIRVRCQGFPVPNLQPGSPVSAVGISSMADGGRALLVNNSGDIQVLTPGTKSCPLYADWNLIGLAAVPCNPDPIHVFANVPFQNGTIDGNLYRWDASVQGLLIYDTWSEPNGLFGNALLGDGYWAVLAQNSALSYEGYEIPSCDQWLSLPSKGWSLLGSPFSSVFDWNQALVTDGRETVPIPDAVTSKHWLPFGGYWWDAEVQGLCDFGIEESFAEFQEWRPWHGYWVISYTDRLALILPR